MVMKTAIPLALAVSLLFAASGRAQLLISEYLANPSGTDSPFEFVELIAAEDIDFSLTPYSIVFGDNGTATANGWVAGGDLTYGFSITAGTVARGDVFYVGGSSMTPTGPKLRVINTGTTPGDRFGNPRSGVLGNGGANADGIAVFNVGIDSLTPATAPVDAVFFGTGVGSAAVSGGAEGYELPVNDLYSGGKLQPNSFVGPDPGGGSYTFLSGTFDYSTGTWVNQRTFTVTPTLSDSISSIILVPEPGTWALIGLGLAGILYRLRRKA
jgi:hypothetical protein